MEQELEYGNTRIPYRLEVSARKNLTVEVHPDQTVVVKAPANIQSERIEEKLLKRAGWIAKQLRHFNEIAKPAATKEFVSGETIRYLGRQYRLKVEIGAMDEAKLLGQYLHVIVKEKSSGQVGKLVDKWYRKQAGLRFAERLEKCFALISDRAVSFPQLEIRRMKSRWGSCTRDGKIILNLDLIKAPVYCIDYVIIHELSHLIEHNHSPAFYRLKTLLMPDWELRKRKLEELEVG